MSVRRSLVWDGYPISSQHLTGKVDRCRTVVNGARPFRIPHSILRKQPRHEGWSSLTAVASHEEGQCILEMGAVR
ncbi:hypothetical protein BD311DRAFT_734276 [Dichomitus squalens]|uniref:Uncharacterized protein n=1 Tax=Dichomitus squalens TaxID=114155 RepID=A0A4Q9M5G7_9APHY|nr:hypothetical protein BD311DRAFT_734276 [Dichomitus squalens]